MCYDGLEFENGTLGEDEIDRARPRPTVERHEDDVDRYPLLSTTSQARQRSTGGDPLRPRKRGNAPRVATPSASQARQRSTVAAPCVPQAKRSSTKLHASEANAAKI